MGIYRTAFLEEEVTHIDDDNNNPIKDIDDIVEDQDANEAEQEEAEEAAYGPDGGVDEIMDESFQAIYEFNTGIDAIMQTIGLHELNEACNGRELIMEAVDIKGFFTSIYNKIKEFFKKVWSVLQRWAGNLKAVFVTNKNFCSKYSAQLQKGYDECTKGSNSSDYKELKGYSFKGLDDAIGFAKAGKSSNEFTGWVDQIKKAKSDLSEKGGMGNDAIQVLNAEQVEKSRDQYRGKLCNKGEVTSSDFRKELREAIYGSNDAEEQSWKEWDPSRLKAVLEGKKADTKTVKDFMTESKKQFKSVMSAVKSLESGVNNMKDDNNKKGKYLSLCTRASEYFRGIMSDTQIWRSCVLSALRRQAVQARLIGMVYIRAYNRDKHKGFRESPSEYGFLGKFC